MAIEDFIKNSWAEYQSYFDKVQYWIYHNPSSVKTIEVAGMALGAIAQLPLLSRRLDRPVLLLSLAGVSLFTIAIIAYKFLEIAVPFIHSMQNHAFQEGAYGVGKLAYVKDIPVLTLNYDTYFDAGKAQGYLLGPNFYEYIQLIDQLRTLNLDEVHTQWRNPDSVPRVIEKLNRTIPTEYKDEMRGFVEGYNIWADENEKEEITFEQLLLLQLIPNSASPLKLEKHTPFPPLKGGNANMACTVVIDHPSIARKLDWPSRNWTGRNSLMIHRKFSSEKKTFSTLSLGFPGLLGDITAWNNQGLFLAMNSCGEPVKMNGMPAIFYNRLLLEHCTDTNQIEESLNLLKPLAPYHLTVADTTTAVSFQITDPALYLRKGARLIVTNNRVDDESIDGGIEREKLIRQLLACGGSVRSCLELPYVTDKKSIQSVFYQVDERKAWIQFDNAFAGDPSKHQEFDLAFLFTNKDLH